jgi:hypothetical protein
MMAARAASRLDMLREQVAEAEAELKRMSNAQYN